ncbi:ABC transporter ATP-binding protein [Gordonia terrae]|uniref:ABC transporter ATP-binding protein n=2 Tax=Gordonia terrae TaxID=2055 RepID=A0AAD0NX86_9ACTN|nr:oligopeptide/dipeptide ABC transporter ATP-binding protein [Gordonia terrae]VTR09608.1 oligopeptide/dipeptide ABC transporter ATPase [Clostridioides difficile]ANY22219.1 peptide ABC transporter ATP-binding protein [Gordonia terrae]AWO82960.1 ABC transporter ATP-binding protein [Gordonia terrae]VTS29927.1 Glutathione import ATP-binding protein GsiA [Gordonia terrae]GAB46313.1 putative ABC transporter ATP-binding protein [Gordonia terrae NBRC 100016]
MAGTGTAHLREEDEVLLTIRDLTVEYNIGRGQKVHAVSGVSLDIARGETLGLVGESGCGKSTVAKAILQLPPPTSGEISFAGQDITTLSAKQMRPFRRAVQMIFQDPISSLNPLRKVRHIVAEGLDIAGDTSRAERAAKVDEILTVVGLDPETAGDRRPHEFSGGQCQRISIARAMVLEPELVVCDEPVSALDVSVQAQILNLLEDMKDRYGLTLLFIAHDLAVVKNISDRIVVMYLGKICEVTDPDGLYNSPLHPYSEALLSAIPDPDPLVPVGDVSLSGELPSPTDPPSGCRFRTRCPRATDVCGEAEPLLREASPGHYVACHHPNLSVALRKN